MSEGTIKKQQEAQIIPQKFDGPQPRTILTPQEAREQATGEGWKKKFMTGLQNMAANVVGLGRAHNQLAAAVEENTIVQVKDHMNIQVIIRTLLENNIVTMDQLNAQAKVIQEEIDEAHRQEEAEANKGKGSVQITYPDREGSAEAGSGDSQAEPVEGGQPGVDGRTDDATGGSGSSGERSQDLREGAQNESVGGDPSGDISARIASVVGREEFESRRQGLGSIGFDS